MRTGRVYALVDVREPFTYRYVGRTVKPLASRLKGHRRAIRELPHLHVVRWFNSIGWHNVRMVELGEYPESELSFMESMWMQALREAGHPLTNIAPAGAGSGFPKGYYRHTAESKAKIAAGKRGTRGGSYWSGKTRSEETKAKIAEGMRRAAAAKQA